MPLFPLYLHCLEMHQCFNSRVGNSAGTGATYQLLFEATLSRRLLLPVLLTRCQLAVLCGATRGDSVCCLLMSLIWRWCLNFLVLGDAWSQLLENYINHRLPGFATKRLQLWQSFSRQNCQVHRNALPSLRHNWQKSVRVSSKNLILQVWVL